MRRTTIRAAPATAGAHSPPQLQHKQIPGAVPPLACLRPCPSVAFGPPSARPAMLALPLTLLTLVALAASAPADRPSAAVAPAPTIALAQPPATAPDTDSSSTFEVEPAQPSATAAAPADPAPATGGSSPLALTFEVASEEEAAPEGELGAGEEMEGAENIVFKPLFRYRERGGFRRRVRASNRRRDASYRRTYAARFPHHRYRSSPKRRNALHTRHQILF